MMGKPGRAGNVLKLTNNSSGRVLWTHLYFILSVVSISAKGWVVFFNVALCIAIYICAKLILKATVLT